MLRFRSYAGLLLAGLLLTGCASRAEIVYAPADERIGALETVFLGTTRALTAEGFTNDRQPGTRFARYDISVPPEREAGSVPFAEGAPNPQQDFLVVDQQHLADASDFQSNLRDALEARPEGQRGLFLYIHGYNNTFAQSLYRTAQMRYDYNIPGLAVHFSWPSRANPRGYIYDGNSVLVARDALSQFLRILAEVRSENFLIMAHSMGAHLTMETLRALAIEGDRTTIDAIDGLVLMSPDIDLDVFRAQATQIAPLPHPFVIFTSQQDRALRLSSQLAGRVNRVGNIDAADDLADYNVTLVDVSEFDGGDGDGLNHMAAATSPELVRFIRRGAEVNRNLEDDAPIETPQLIPGTINIVRNATQIVLSPLQ
ncbi:MAG: alpha/beta hydrolase [Pseudomonadota bacterium]